jgi:hypothetical protein
MLRCNYLDNNFPDRQIGQGVPNAWPLRSLELSNTPPDFNLWGCMKGDYSRSQKSNKLYQVAAADIVPKHLVSVKALIQRCRETCSGEDKTLQTSVAIMYITFSALASPHPTNRKVLNNKYSEVTTEKCYKGQSLLSLQTRKYNDMLK